MGFYSVIGFLRPAVYFFLLPVYIAFFTDAEYAIYNLMIDFAAIAMIVVSFKLNTSMLTHYYDYMGKPAEQKKYLQTLYTSSIILGVIFIALMYLIGPVLFTASFKDDSILFFPYGMIVVIYVALFESNQVYINFLRNEKNVFRYSLVMLVHIIGIIVFQFVFIILLKRGVNGALEGILLGNIIVTLLIVYLERSLLKFSLDKKQLVNSLKFSITLLPYLIIYWFLTRGGRFFLESFTDLEKVALFALMMVLGGIIILAVEAIVNGIRPFLFEEFAKRKNADENRIKLMSKMVINLPLLAVPALVLVATFFRFFTSNLTYSVIDNYMPTVCFLYFLMVWSKLFYQQLLFAKKSKLITVLALISAFVLIAGFIYLIPVYEIWGVLIATILANAVSLILFYAAAQKVHHVNYDFKAIFGAPVIVFTIIFFLQYLFLINNINMQIFGCLQFVLCLIFIIGINRNTVKEYKRIFIE